MNYDPIFDISNKVVVVTGGLGILGLNFVKALLERKAKVAVMDLAVSQETLLNKLGKLCEDEYFLFVPSNVIDRESVEKALKVIENQWETPFGLVNNAALDSPPNSSTSENGPIETFPVTSWDRVMDVNVKGPLIMAQVFGHAMAQVGKGSIINVSSTYGMVSPDQRLYQYREKKEGKPFYKPIAYSASKSALFNLTRYLATYWGKQGVRVNTLTFGGVFSHQDEEFLQEYTHRTPMGRMAHEDEYNGAVLFLLSEASSYMTGSNLVLDGGFTAW